MKFSAEFSIGIKNGTTQCRGYRINKPENFSSKLNSITVLVYGNNLAIHKHNILLCPLPEIVHLRSKSIECSSRD